MQAEIYGGDYGFDDWAGVLSAFGVKEDPKPSQVFLADYDMEGYGGRAYVVYRKGRSYYTVSGSHCSCYGLEGQWEPEKYTKQQLIEALKKSSRDKREDELLATLEATE